MQRVIPILVFLFVCLAFRQASAVPILQLYLEGGTYDAETESWVLTPEGSSGGAPFRLWAIGNTRGPGSAGTIFDVRLSIAFDRSEYEARDDLSITLMSSQAGGDGSYNGVSDLSPATLADLRNNEVVPTSLGGFETGNDGVVTNGGAPVLYDGKILPSHGIYGGDTVWQEYQLGDFDKYDSQVGDFIDEFPTELFENAAQINVYEISVTGGSGLTLHFDLYNHVQAKNKAVFAPFSHNAETGGDVNIVPEPSMLALWMLLGVPALGSVGLRRRRA